MTTRLSAGTHGLIQPGAPLIRDAADVLDLLAGATGREFARAAAAAAVALDARRCSGCSTRSRTAAAR